MGAAAAAVAVGFGAAARMAVERVQDGRKRLSGLRNQLWSDLQERLDGLFLNGSEFMRLPGNLNFRIEGVDADDVIRAAPEVAVSTGSACSSASSDPSHVLVAIGLTEPQIRSSIRIGIGRPNTVEEIETAADVLSRAIARARA